MIDKKHIFTYIMIMKRYIFIILFLISACAKNEEKKIVARRLYMHTFVEIQILGKNQKKIQYAINKAFDAIAETETNTSKFISASDVSKIKSAAPNQKIKISDCTFKCLSLAKDISKKTCGKYDVTISPLIDLWGFGRKNNKRKPEKNEIKKALEKIGADKFVLLFNCNSVSVTVEGVDIDLSSIAKGAAVDAAAETLFQYGFSNFLINAGGEIRTSSTGEKIWHIGIQAPKSDAGAGEIIEDDVLEIKNKSVATSGNYRNYYKEGANTYSHIIDPKTGYPVESKVLSVTVTAPTCAEADAWATAFFALPVDEAIALADKNSRVECLIIERPEKKGHKFKILNSKNF